MTAILAVVALSAFDAAVKLGLTFKPFRGDGGKGAVDESRVCVRSASGHGDTLLAWSKACNLTPLFVPGYAQDKDGVCIGGTAHYAWMFFDAAQVSLATVPETDLPTLPAKYTPAKEAKPLKVADEPVKPTAKATVVWAAYSVGFDLCSIPHMVGVFASESEAAKACVNASPVALTVFATVEDFKASKAKN